jgi:hypothetical protein
MTKEEINKLIVESNLLITTVTNGYQVWMPENLEKFAKLVAAAEREACAKLCDELVLEHPGRADLTAIQCANAIRARGNNGT